MSVQGYPVPPSSSLAPTPSFGASALMSGGGQPGWLTALQGIRGVTQQLSAGFADDPNVRAQQGAAIQQQQMAAAEQKHAIFTQIMDSATRLAGVYQQSGAGPNHPGFQAYAKQVEGQLTRLGIPPEDVGAFMQQLYAEVSAPMPNAQTVRTLSPEEVTAAGFRSGSVVQQKPDGSFDVSWYPGSPQLIGENTGRPRVFNPDNQQITDLTAPPAAPFLTRLAGYESPEGTASGQYFPKVNTYGKYQFKPGTLESLGYTAEQLQDPWVEREAVNKLTANNAANLEKWLGRKPNDTEVYVAHLLGANGAKTFLSASPDADIRTVLPANVIEANPKVFEGKTQVDEVMAGLAQHFGTEATWTEQQQFDTEDAPSGFYWTDETRRRLSPIPGGPKDPANAKHGGGITVFGEDGNPIVQVGGSGMGMGPAATNQYQQTLLGQSNQLARLSQIENSFRPEFLTFENKFGAWGAALAEKINPELLDDADRQALTDFTAFKRDSFENLNQTIKEMSGQAITAQEGVRLQRQIPSPGEGIFDGDSPTQFRAKLLATIQLMRHAMMRANYASKHGLSPLTAGIELADIPALTNKRGKEIERELRQRYPDVDDAGIKQLTAQNLAAEFGLMQ